MLALFNIVSGVFDVDKMEFIVKLLQNMLQQALAFRCGIKDW